MSHWPRCLALSLASALAAGATTDLRAQAESAPPPRSPRSTQTLSTTVHAAWLQEVLDLDVRGAIKAYDRISKQAPRNQPERWIAVTRLAELQRIGLEAAEPGPLQPSPAAVRKALSELDQPLPIDELLADPLADITLPPLHPATLQVQDWVRNQIGPSVDERMRLRMLRYGRNASNRSFERWYAADVLRAETRGRPAQAQATRALCFANWQPPELTDDTAGQLEKARVRLAAWIADPETSSTQRMLLGELSKAIEQHAETDPRAALEFLIRIPIYSDRLLGEEPTTTGGEAADTSGSGSAGGR